MKVLRGFTLIELMVTVAIIAVLAAIAIPSYISYVVRGNRSAAEQLMMEIATKEQQYLLDARGYTATIGAGGLNLTVRDRYTCAATCTSPSYTISVTFSNTATPPTFSITGTPQGAQAADGTLTLDNTGTKTRIVNSVDQGW